MAVLGQAFNLKGPSAVGNVRGQASIRAVVTLENIFELLVYPGSTLEFLLAVVYTGGPPVEEAAQGPTGLSQRVVLNSAI